MVAPVGWISIQNGITGISITGMKLPFSVWLTLPFSVWLTLIRPVCMLAPCQLFPLDSSLK